MKIYAHRGASGEYPENTLLAFEQAVAQNADGIELDVFQNKDAYVIYHDRLLSSKEGKRQRISDSSSFELAQITLPKNQFIPTLEQALICIGGRCDVNIEIKHINDVAGFCKIINDAVSTGICNSEQLLLSSFNHPLLLKVSALLPQIRVGILLACIPQDLKGIIGHEDVDSVHLSLDAIDQSVIEEARDLGVKTLVYTVDRHEDIELMRTWGVDGIFTNYPAQARQLLSQHSDGH